MQNIVDFLFRKNNCCFLTCCILVKTNSISLNKPNLHHPLFLAHILLWLLYSLIQGKSCSLYKPVSVSHFITIIIIIYYVHLHQFTHHHGSYFSSHHHFSFFFFSCIFLRHVHHRLRCKTRGFQTKYSPHESL